MVLCAHIGLGTKNRSILSLEALRQHGLHVVGATFIGKTNDDTMKTLGDFLAISEFWPSVRSVVNFQNQYYKGI
ncbi:MAG TPA: hypothetical protein DCS30_05320 [Rhizobiales bacterium]|nr:hypothetical protein [Hyphomicrobiales bacterium]